MPRRRCPPHHQRLELGEIPPLHRGPFDATLPYRLVTASWPWLERNVQVIEHARWVSRDGTRPGATARAVSGERLRGLPYKFSYFSHPGGAIAGPDTGCCSGAAASASASASAHRASSALSSVRSRRCIVARSRLRFAIPFSQVALRPGEAPLLCKFARATGQLSTT